MTQVTRPTKQLVRDFTDERMRAADPPPTPEEIRRQLGWYMLPANRQPDRDDAE